MKKIVIPLALLVAYIGSAQPAKSNQLISPRQHSVSQELKVQGTVIDAKTNQPIAAVSIAVKGTDRGTQTDQNGNFVIEARTGEILVASIIGYGSLELPVAEQVEFSLVPDEETLEEVVVVGYGTQSRREITSAVASVKEKDFNRGGVRNPMELVQ